MNSVAQAVGVELFEGVGDHVRIEVAGRAGGDLDGLRAGGAQAHGVVLGLEIADDGGGAGHVAQRALQQRGLAGAGGGEQVEDLQPFGAEPAAVLVGVALVEGQRGLLHLEGADRRRMAMRVVMRMGMLMAMFVG